MCDSKGRIKSDINTVAIELMPDETVDSVPPYAPTTKSDAAPGLSLSKVKILTNQKMLT